MDYILRIKQLIVEKNTKTYELASAISVSPNTINNWLAERNPMPVPGYIGICDYFNVPYSYFLEASPIEKLRKPSELPEIDKLRIENNLLKDKIIRLQEELYDRSIKYLNEKAG